MSKAACGRNMRKRKQPSETSLIDQFSPVVVKKIVPTTTKKKEDAFAKLRPQSGECLDYNISQTALKFDVAGARINVQDTVATYVSAPAPVRRKNKRDRPPPYKFINEIWLEKKNAAQAKYRKEFVKNLKIINKKKKLKFKKKHEMILSLSGPIWFQELSPSQLRAVDQLQCSIYADIKNHSITNVQEVIGKLGLVLRPNHHHVALALSLCCNDAVEFLLVLYQITNPHRTEYSLNDRLLLSAAVHLSMTNTLRELHIRIPSPPVVKKVQEKKPKPEKKIKYASPYLEPIIFKVEPIVDRVYGSSRIQYPESPYFSYLNDMNKEREIAEDIFEIDITELDEEEARLLSDMRNAQLKYDQLGNGERVKLLKPTVLKKCDDLSNYYKSLSGYEPEIIPPPVPSLRDSNDDDDEDYCVELEEAECSVCQSETTSSESEEICGSEEAPEQATTTKSKDDPKKEKKKEKTVLWVIKGIAVTRNKKMVPIIETTVMPKPSPVEEQVVDKPKISQVDLERVKTKFVVGGIAVTKDGPVAILSAAVDPNRLKDLKKKYEEEPEEEEDTILKKINRMEEKHYKEMIRKRERTLKCTCVTKSWDKSTNVAEVVDSCPGRGYGDDSEEEEEPPVCECEDCKCKELSKKYTGRKCKKCLERNRQKYVRNLITGLKTTTNNKVVPIIGGTQLVNTCDCLEKYAERILSTEARKVIQSQRTQFVIGGVTCTKNGPVYILSAAVNTENKVCCKPERRRRSCSRGKREEEEEETEPEDLKYSGCKCREELDRFLAHKCNCDLCNQLERHREGVTYVVGGTTTKYNNTSMKIIQGVYDQRCDCFERYKQKIEKLEEYRQRIEARYNLKAQSLKYSIGGVVNTPEGPAYIITGMRPPVDCQCGRALREREEEERCLQQMAKMPPTGRVKYQIAGVRQTPEGNVFIISQAQAIEDCECLKLYDSYAQAHKACLDMYENFLKKTTETLKEYEAELKAEAKKKAAVGFSGKTQGTQGVGVETGQYITLNWMDYIESSETSFSNYNLFEKGEVVRGMETKCQGQKLNICSGGEICSLSDESICSCDKDDEAVCRKLEYDLEEGWEEESFVGSHEAEEHSLEKVDVEAEESLSAKEVEEELERFVILEKMPRSRKKWMQLLKKVLSKMAEDDFPIAKLPDCHKLPHFKLWIELRLHTFWRQKDIDTYEVISKLGWCHTDLCRIKYKFPTIGMTPQEAGKMTWKQADYIKKFVGDRVNMFYRQINQRLVDSAREFFPLTFSYEFPNKTFRDVFFAYLPSKEEDTKAFNIVKKCDTRVITKKYSCYC